MESMESHSFLVVSAFFFFFTIKVINYQVLAVHRVRNFLNIAKTDLLEPICRTSMLNVGHVTSYVLIIF